MSEAVKIDDGSWAPKLCIRGLVDMMIIASITQQMSNFTDCKILIGYKTGRLIVTFFP